MNLNWLSNIIVTPNEEDMTEPSRATRMRCEGGRKAWGECKRSAALDPQKCTEERDQADQHIGKARRAQHGISITYAPDATTWVHRTNAGLRFGYKAKSGGRSLRDRYARDMCRAMPLALVMLYRAPASTDP
jgi:hypothetical protein